MSVEQWEKIIFHSNKEIKGFYGDYRFLSNLWPAKVFLDGEEYPSVENAYQAMKYKKEEREIFKTCSGKEAAVFTKTHPMTNSSPADWSLSKLGIMQNLLSQKFDKNLNPELVEKLKSTGDKYLEETNYWGDMYWGVFRTGREEKGEGENNLGKLLMTIRTNL